LNMMRSASLGAAGKSMGSDTHLLAGTRCRRAACTGVNGGCAT
jgi:hypothetical protein